VDDAFFVGRLHRPRQGLHQPRRLRRRQRGPLELPVEAAAVHELQGKERQPVVLADSKDLNDVGVLQPRRRLRLGTEAGQFLRPGVRPRQDHLQGDGALQRRLPRLVDDAHAAATQFPQHLEPRHRGPVRGASADRGSSGEDGAVKPAGVDGAVHLELQRQLRGVLREAAPVLLQLRGLARLLAQQDLVVDEVEEAVGVVP
jgi:hypothetical protein